MTLPVYIRAEAEQDLDEAAGWYEKQQPELGEQFLDEVLIALRSICERPNMYPSVGRGARRTLIRRFPFGVYYLENNMITMQPALLIAFLSLCVSVFAFYRGSTRAQNKRTKREKMRLVVARSVIVWDQMHTVVAAKIGGYSIDNYFFPSYQRNIQRLEDAIDNAVAVGLFEDLIGVQENALVLHSAFIQSLAHMERLSPESAEIDDWIKENFTMGMIRLLDRCVCFHGYTLPKELRDDLEKETSKLRDAAWTYISHN